jgi:hypothetical protein
MSDCLAMREQMPLLLTESLDPARRELTHQHIESCDACGEEFAAAKETWRMLAELPEVEPPARMKQNFLIAAGLAPAAAVVAAPSNVVPFHRRAAAKWLAQAAAVVALVTGSYFAGHRSTPITVAPSEATLTGIQRVSAPLQTSQPFYRIAESSVLSAADVNPTIEGRPDIQNVQFIRPATGEQKIGVSFDITSHVTVTGDPNDKSMVRLLSYVLENEDHMSPSRSRAIDWVRQTYSDPGKADPEIASSLAKVLRNDTHEGVRIKAVDTLKMLPQTMTTETREALIHALKDDPNPAVRIKAVEALAKLAENGGQLDTVTLDTLREKASQDDENPYIRVKAADVLSKIRP